MEKISDIHLGSLGKRAFGFLLDLLFILFLVAITYLPTVEGYIDYGFRIPQKLNEIKQIQVDSGLFFDDTKLGQPPLSEVNYISAEKLTDENGYFTYEDSHMVFLKMLYNFYYVYLDEIDSYGIIFEKDPTKEELNAWFYKNVCNIDNEEYPNFEAFYIINGDKYSDPLTFDEKGEVVSSNIGILDKVTYSSVIYEKNPNKPFSSPENQNYIRAYIRIFADTESYPGSYHQACFYLRDTDNYYSIYTELERVGRYSLYVSLGIALIIYFLIIPLLSKNGQTISNRMMHLALVNNKDYQVSKLQILTKYLFISAEAFAGYFSLGLFYLIDFALIIFTKNHTSLSDLISLTKVIDTKNSVWFLNRETEEKLMAQIEERTNSFKKDENIVINQNLENIDNNEGKND